MRRDDLRASLREWSLPVDDDARAGHRAALAQALDDAPEPARRPVRIPRRVAWVAAALVGALLPTAAAVAAESSLPGDLLYPIKRVTEEIRSWWDDDISAEHRVEEVEGLVNRGRTLAELTDEIDAARTEVDRLGEDHPLQQRLDTAIDSDEQPSDDADDGTSEGSDRPTATTVPVTTTVAPSDDAPPASSESPSSGSLTLSDLELLARIRATEIPLDSLPTHIASSLARLREGRHMTEGEAAELIAFFEAHPELLDTGTQRTTTTIADHPTETTVPGDATTTTVGERPTDEASTTTTQAPSDTTTLPADGGGSDRPRDTTTTTVVHDGGNGGGGEDS